MKLSALIAPLIAAHAPHDQIMAVVVAFEAQQDDALARRRAADAERQSRKRSRDVTLRHSDRSLTGDRVAPVDSKTLDLDKDKRKEEPSGSSKKRGSRLPADFHPDLDWAVAQGLSPSQVQNEAAKFADYWLGVAGAKGVKENWPATWRNWVRSALERSPSARGSPQPKASSTSALANSAARIVQSMRSNDEIRSRGGSSGLPALIPHLPVR